MKAKFLSGIAKPNSVSVTQFSCLCLIKHFIPDQIGQDSREEEITTDEIYRRSTGEDRLKEPAPTASAIPHYQRGHLKPQPTDSGSSPEIAFRPCRLQHVDCTRQREVLIRTRFLHS